MTAQSSLLSAQQADAIADALADEGKIILDDLLPASLIEQLRLQVSQLADSEFKAAGVGRGQDHQYQQAIRRDQIHWLSQADATQKHYLDWMDSLREALNQRLFMGLFDYEAHYAHYPPGAFYKRHLDAFRGNTNRVLTSVCYLNDNWQPEDAGELLIYPQQGDQVLEKVAPKAGRLVIFLSEQFPHEVLAAKRDRYSIAGWFRQRG